MLMSEVEKLFLMNLMLREMVFDAVLVEKMVADELDVEKMKNWRVQLVRWSEVK
jgi:hypothetical protein